MRADEGPDRDVVNDVGSALHMCPACRHVLYLPPGMGLHVTVLTILQRQDLVLLVVGLAVGTSLRHCISRTPRWQNNETSDEKDGVVT